ncbi:MAG TPA: hypothetical protein VFS40_14165 [Gemmatimonadales bacterium]|nr:hypothetical protein [Gemmatimonadales bacterium]
MRTALRTLAAGLGLATGLALALPAPLWAQHEHHAAAATDSAAAADSAFLAGRLGLPLARMGSGTSWLPDAAPMHAFHVETGGWRLMAHGEANLMYDRQGGPRGATQVSSTNWAMLMAMRPVGGGLLHLHAMASAEPLTVGERGYPLLLQSGETVDGEPLHDRQHPHDLFMELAAMYDHPLARGLALSLYAAPVGEPVVGPVAYMHRPSAEGDPLAAIAHHWQDATHITYGVLTAGLFTRHVKLEASLFNGREPDEDRWDFDFGPLDAWGVRLSVNPSPHWSGSAWAGRLQDVEPLRPGQAQDRIGAMLVHTAALGARSDVSSAVVWGATRHRGGHDEAHADAAAGEPFDHSLVLESNLRLAGRNDLFTRLTYVRKRGEDLAIPGQDETPYDVGSVVLGYVRELARPGGLSVGLGARGALNLVPAALAPVYGSRTPLGLAVYLRVRPASMTMHAGAAGMPGMRM